MALALRRGPNPVSWRAQGPAPASSRHYCERAPGGRARAPAPSRRARTRAQTPQWSTAGWAPTAWARSRRRTRAPRPAARGPAPPARGPNTFLWPLWILCPARLWRPAGRAVEGPHVAQFGGQGPGLGIERGARGGGRVRSTHAGEGFEGSVRGPSWGIRWGWNGGSGLRCGLDASVALHDGGDLRGRALCSLGDRGQVGRIEPGVGNDRFITHAWHHCHRWGLREGPGGVGMAAACGGCCRGRPLAPLPASGRQRRRPRTCAAQKRPKHASSGAEMPSPGMAAAASAPPVTAWSIWNMEAPPMVVLMPNLGGWWQGE